MLYKIERMGGVNMKTDGLKTIGLMVALALIIACGDKIEPGNIDTKSPGKVRVAVGTVAMADRPFHFSAVGSVEAGISSTLSSKLMRSSMGGCE